MGEIRDMGLLQGFGCTKCENRHFYGGFVLTLFPHDGVMRAKWVRTSYQQAI